MAGLFCWKWSVGCFLASPAKLGRCEFLKILQETRGGHAVLSGAASKPNVRLGLFKEGLKSLARVSELVSNKRGNCSASLPEEPCEHRSLLTRTALKSLLTRTALKSLLTRTALKSLLTRTAFNPLNQSADPGPGSESSD